MNQEQIANERYQTIHPLHIDLTTPHSNTLYSIQHQTVNSHTRPMRKFLTTPTPTTHKMINVGYFLFLSVLFLTQTQSSFAQTTQQDDTTNPQLPTLYHNSTRSMCEEETFTGRFSLTYEYSIEMSPSLVSNLEEQVASLKESLLGKLEQILKCSNSIPVDIESDIYHHLDIVGIDSLPLDEPSSTTSCQPNLSSENTCIMMNGSFTLFLSQKSKLKYVRYTTRHIIDQTMSDYVSSNPDDSTQSILQVLYKGPHYSNPLHQDDDYSSSTDTDKKIVPLKTLSSVEVIVAASLVSSMFGIFGVFLLSRRFSQQNCLAPCDGTGIDKQYMDTYGGGNHHPEDPSSSVSSSRKKHALNQKFDVEWMNHNLDVIHETEDESTQPCNHDDEYEYDNEEEKEEDISYGDDFYDNISIDASEITNHSTKTKIASNKSTDVESITTFSDIYVL